MKTSLKETVGTAVLSGVVYVVLILVVVLCVSTACLEALLKRLTLLITSLNEKMMIPLDWTVEICSRFATAVITSKLWKNVISAEDLVQKIRKKLRLKPFD